MAEFFSGVYFGSTLIQYGLLFATIIAFIILGRIFNYFLEVHVAKLAAKTKTKFDDVLLESSKKPVLFFFLIVGVSFGKFFLSLTPELSLTIGNIIGLLFIINIVWFLLKLVDAIVNEIIIPITEKTDSKLDDQLIPIASSASKGAIVAMGIIIALSNFGYDVTAIIAGLGIGGLAVAFAAQQTISDAFGGINIFISKPFLVGDTIQAVGVLGTVEKVGLRHTRIRDFDGRINIVSNSKLSASVIKNRSSEPGRKIKLNLGVTYGTSLKNLKLAMKMIEDIIKAQKNIDQASYRIGFSEFKDFSLNILVMYYVKEKSYVKILETQSFVNLAIKEAFEKNKIDFAFPTQTIHLEK